MGAPQDDTADDIKTAKEAVVIEPKDVGNVADVLGPIVTVVETAPTATKDKKEV